MVPKSPSFTRKAEAPFGGFPVLFPLAVLFPLQVTKDFERLPVLKENSSLESRTNYRNHLGESTQNGHHTIRASLPHLSGRTCITLPRDRTEP